MRARDYLKKFVKPILIDRARTTILSIPTKARKTPPTHYLNYVLPNKSPIILLQGFGTTWRTISILGDYISKLGYPVHVVDQLGHNTIDIPSGAKMVREHLEKEQVTNGVIVSHSKGGLIGKYLLTYHNENKLIKGMAAISCPFNGTAFAALLPWKKSKELDIGSPIITDLGRHTEQNNRIISIFSKKDEQIWADQGCYLQGALDNVITDTPGHSNLLFNSQGREVVKKAIEKIEKLDC